MDDSSRGNCQHGWSALKALGITKVSFALKVTAVVLSRPLRPAPEREPDKADCRTSALPC